MHIFPRNQIRLTATLSLYQLTSMSVKCIMWLKSPWPGSGRQFSISSRVLFHSVLLFNDQSSIPLFKCLWIKQQNLTITKLWSLNSLLTSGWFYCTLHLFLFLGILRSITHRALSTGRPKLGFSPSSVFQLINSPAVLVASLGKAYFCNLLTQVFAQKQFYWSSGFK